MKLDDPFRCTLILMYSNWTSLTLSPCKKCILLNWVIEWFIVLLESQVCDLEHPLIWRQTRLECWVMSNAVISGCLFWVTCVCNYCDLSAINPTHPQWTCWHTVHKRTCNFWDNIECSLVPTISLSYLYSAGIVCKHTSVHNKILHHYSS